MAEQHPKQDPAEKRRNHRHSVSTEFRLGDEGGVGAIILDSANISTGGAFLETEILFEIGEELDIHFALDGGLEVTAHGRIAWVKTDHSGGLPPGMGIQFVDLSDEAKVGIHEYLDHHHD